MPSFLVFFVTSKCNLSCSHCFYWKSLNSQKQELTLEHIEKIVDSFEESQVITLTGGEVFLRHDAIELCRLFSRKFRQLRIVSNGHFTSRIVDTVRAIVDECAFEHVAIHISIDGLEETHNAIRGSKHSFSNAMHTIEGLTALSLEKKKLSVQSSSVISKKNYKEISKLSQYLLQFPIQQVYTPVRGSTFGTFNLDKDVMSDIDPPQEMFVGAKELREVYSSLEDIHRTSHFTYWSKESRLLLSYSIDTLQEGKRMIPCYAGDLDAVIYENGDVGVCESSIPIGNLSETNYDFLKIWNGKKADMMRAKTKKCACIQGCNLSTSIRTEMVHLTIKK